MVAPNAECIMLKLLDDEFLIADDTCEEVADRHDADHEIARRHDVPVRGMSSLIAAELIAIGVAGERGCGGTVRAGWNGLLDA
jgi:hypothetical protein